jgi:hypothetical protein
MYQAYHTSTENVLADYMGLFVSGTTVSVDLTLSEILKQQIELTRHFLNSQERMYEAYCTAVENMSAGYKPVTLEDTKEVSCYLHLFILLTEHEMAVNM